MAYTPSPTLLAAVGTGNVLSTRRPLDISDDIAFYEPSANPFFLLARQSDKRASIDPEFKMLESQIQPYFDAVNNGAGYSAVATGIVVDNISYFKAQDLVQVTRTKEIMLVSSITAGTSTLTVIRGYGSTGGTLIVDNDEIRRVGNAFEEGAGIDTSKTVKVDAITNYTEIFKTSLTLTNTEMNTTLYGGKDLTLRQKQAGQEHAQKIESSFLFGQRAEYTTSTTGAKQAGTHPIRLSGGIIYFVSSNTLSVGGALTEATFNQSFLKDVFTADKNARKKRTLFVSPLVGSVMNQWANGKIELVPSDTTFGITVNRYKSFLGEVNLVMHPLLEGTTYGGYAIAVNLEDVSYRFLTNRDTVLNTDVVKSGADQRVDEYITECGLGVRLEGTHGYAYGING